MAHSSLATLPQEYKFAGAVWEKGRFDVWILDSTADRSGTSGQSFQGSPLEWFTPRDFE